MSAGVVHDQEMVRQTYLCGRCRERIQIMQERGHWSDLRMLWSPTSIFIALCVEWSLRSFKWASQRECQWFNEHCWFVCNEVVSIDTVFSPFNKAFPLQTEGPKDWQQAIRGILAQGHTAQQEMMSVYLNASWVPAGHWCKGFQRGYGDSFEGTGYWQVDGWQRCPFLQGPLPTIYCRHAVRCCPGSYYDKEIAGHIFLLAGQFWSCLLLPTVLSETVDGGDVIPEACQKGSLIGWNNGQSGKCTSKDRK